MSIQRDENGNVDVYAWPGGYPLYYIVQGDVLCPKCVNDNKGNESFEPEACDVNWEDESLYCSHCNAQIAPAYGEGE